MHKSRPTFTFLVLLLAVGATTVIALSMNRSYKKSANEVALVVPDKDVKPANEVAQTPAPVNLDTTKWKDYIDRTYFLSFKYPPTWQVETYPQQAGYYIIVLKPDNSAEHIHIYVSPDNYFALAGLPYKSDTLAGTRALNVNDMLVGVKYAAQYYTFDMGANSKLQPQFKRILSTVAFSK